MGLSEWVEGVKEVGMALCAAALLGVRCCTRLLTGQKGGVKKCRCELGRVRGGGREQVTTSDQTLPHPH